MKKRKKKIPFAKAAALVFVLAAAVFLSLNFLPAPYRRFLAGLMPIETITPEQLKTAYARRDLKILLVPGHDNTDSGTEFNGVREADMNRELAGELYDILKDDGRFKVFATRDFLTGGYTPVFSSYFAGQEKEILSFRARLIETMISALKTGRFEVRTGVGHNNALSRVVQKLYGINKWANENDIDVILHIHFNDHAGRRPGRVGDYEGFTIYIPEKQFSSSRASRAVAESIFNRLQNNFSVSTLKGESGGLTEDQELIAVGARGSLDGVGLLIEYGYIYEPQFADKDVRGAVMAELAHQTYAGIKKYLEPTAVIGETTLLPYNWQKPLSRGIKGDRDALSLQAALHAEGFYPPPGKDLAECSLSGNFGPCTEAAVKLFQEKYAGEILRPAGLASGTGSAGPSTIKKLNDLYGSGFARRD